MTQPYHLSVLDQSPIARGSTARDALLNTIDLARHADRLGYRRYWLAEHHASPGLAGVAPEVMIGPVALATSRIRLGSGGIMLPHYSPFKVAETFSLLAALAPDRIDLGLGRAPGSDQRTAYALQRDRSRRMPSDDFADHVTELLGYLDDALPEDHAFAALARTLPSGGGEVAPWLLGSSPDSAVWAGEMGLPYCFADFINPAGAGIVDLYRRRFRPSIHAAEPYVMAASWTIAAETDEAAERLAAPAAMMFAHLVRGELIAVPPVDEAVAWLAANPDPGQRRRRTVVGSVATVRAGLDAVAAEYGAQELMLVNILPDHAARVSSYRRIAEEYGLAESAAAR